MKTNYVSSYLKMRVVIGTLIYLLFSNVCCGKNPEQIQHAEETDKQVEQDLETLNSGNDDKTDGKQSDTDHASLIINGNSAQRGEYPWMVSLYEYGLFICGGSILNARTILTAAHCVDYTYGEKDLQVRAGDHMMKRKDTYEQRVFAEEVIIHPDYNINGQLMWDIAILKLKKDLEYNDYVQPISIPTNRKEKVLSKIGRCTLSGFGQISYPQKNLPQVLQELDTRITDRKVCSKIIRLYYRGQVFNKNVICSDTNESGACYGDSGGPFICYDSEDTPYQVGIVSWGSQNCFEGFTVYTRVSRFARWINKHT